MVQLRRSAAPPPPWARRSAHLRFQALTLDQLSALGSHAPETSGLAHGLSAKPTTAEPAPGSAPGAGSAADSAGTEAEAKSTAEDKSKAAAEAEGGAQVVGEGPYCWQRGEVPEGWKAYSHAWLWHTVVVDCPKYSRWKLLPLSSHIFINFPSSHSPSLLPFYHLPTSSHASISIILPKKPQRGTYHPAVGPLPQVPRSYRPHTRRRS